MAVGVEPLTKVDVATGHREGGGGQQHGTECSRAVHLVFFGAAAAIRRRIGRDTGH